jgi:hypothetical protein
VSATRRRSVAAESRTRRAGVERQHVLFGPLSRALRAVAASLRPARLCLLLDEWSSIPLDLQPLLADLLRRGVLPVRGITVKIAAIERRSRLALPTHQAIEELYDARLLHVLRRGIVDRHHPGRLYDGFNLAKVAIQLPALSR